MLECLDSRYILKAKGDALHWKKVYVVNTVSLVEEKAINNICDEPQNQRVERKSLGTFSRLGDGFLCIYWCFIVSYLDF